MEEFKVLKDYTENHTTQRPFKNNQARSGDNKKRTKNFNFKGKTQKVNTVATLDVPILTKIRGKGRRKIPRVIRSMQTHQRMKPIMVLTA